MKKSIFSFILFVAGTVTICWLCDWKAKAIAWMLLFWAVLAVSVAGATLSEYIEARKAMRKAVTKNDQRRSN